jgi:hypothetical protein
MHLFREQAHGHGRDDEGKNDGQQAEEIAQAGLVVEEKGREEKPAGDEQENGDDDIGSSMPCRGCGGYFSS